VFQAEIEGFSERPSGLTRRRRTMVLSVQAYH
jgi:hypothetical protein